MNHSFFALLSRMKYISRWALMRNAQRENLSEHSLETAVIAHALAVFRNSYFSGSCDPAQIALLAVYHDVPEILTGDMPTPVKYFSPQIRSAYGEVEKASGERLLSKLPSELQQSYEPLLLQDSSSPEHELVKAADKLSALIKCMEERKTGNMEFLSAEKSTLKALHDMNLPEVELFIKDYLPAYMLTLDEQS